MLADADSGLGVVKGADDAAEGFEGCKGVQGSDGVDVLADGGKRSRVKNVDVIKLSDKESVRWWRWLGERRDVLQIDGERRVGAAFAEGGR